MKKISYWASKNKWISRFLIIAIYILLNAIGIYTGKLLYEINVLLPALYLNACVVLTLGLWLGYPTKSIHNRSSNYSYRHRKIFDFSLGLVTFLMIVFAGNHWKNPGIETEAVFAAKLTPSSNEPGLQNHPLIKNFTTELTSKDATQLSNREKLRLIKKQVKNIKQNKETSDGGKTALIILSVIVALGLLFGLAALACHISCTGTQAMAIIVAVLGTVLIISLLVKVIRSITRPRKPVEKPVTEAGDGTG